MNFVLLIKAGHAHAAAMSAYHFARAAIQKNHIIQQVFFYQDGVYLANNLATPAQDDIAVSQCWTQLAEKYQIPLLVCVAAAAKRGVLDQETATYYDKSVTNVEQPFVLVGLGQFAAALANADRVISFDGVC